MDKRGVPRQDEQPSDCSFCIQHEVHFFVQKKAALKESGDTETLCGLTMPHGHRAGDCFGALAPIAARLTRLVILVVCPLADDVLYQFQDPIILRAIYFLRQRHHLLLIRRTKKVASSIRARGDGKN